MDPCPARVRFVRPCHPAKAHSAKIKMDSFVIAFPQLSPRESGVQGNRSVAGPGPRFRRGDTERETGEPISYFSAYGLSPGDSRI